MKDFSIVICGEAGQGIQTVESILTRILKLSGLYVFSTREFMSRIRGGSNSTEIRVSDEKISTWIDRIDVLIPLSKKAVSHVRNRISEDTIIMGEEKYIDKKSNTSFQVPFTEIAEDAGSKLYANTAAVGVMCGILDIDEKIMNDYIEDYFKSKEKAIIEGNIKAAGKGYKKGKEIKDAGKIKIRLKKDMNISDSLILSGTDTVSMGAIAGGCSFISSYPMSPSTGVLVFLAGQAEDFGIVVEQAEDEISAINMILGAWYAGGRGMVTTSGGGFALMVEGISLAGMLETPAVIHLAQRPGPATGLPTRTEQGDLLFAVHAGHGEFPRIILTPGTPEEAFYGTQKAFNLADKFQVPVIIMTDQYFLDSTYTISNLDISGLEVTRYIEKTDKDYRRYEITDNGITPRGIPGYGEGTVSVDSDEHDEEGHITEDLPLRTEMVDKRLRKENAIIDELIEPELTGNEDYRTLIISWGSTYYAVKESLKNINNEGISFLHYKQVYPLHPETEKYLTKAEQTIMVESNATAQFAKLIKQETGIDIDRKILKYNGLAFTVEELTEKLTSIIGEEPHG